MIYDLPKAVEVQGAEYEVRTDYRDILNICTALSDPELSEDEKYICSLDIFYPAFETMPPVHYEDALNECYRFINCGQNVQEKKNGPKLVDWEQDFKYIVAPINHICGQEIRSIPYMHWWTFISYYQEIGSDCTFAQIVSIRDKLAKGKALDKQERQWYHQNKSLVDFKNKYTEEDQGLLEEWGGKKKATP
jgi:hypothetical protein